MNEELLQPSGKKLKIAFMESYWNHRENLAIVTTLMKSLYMSSTYHPESTLQVEKMCCKMFNSKYAIAVDRGRSAILLGLRALNIKEGDEIVVPSFFCRTVAQSIIQVGAKLIFADSNYDMNIDPASIRRCITKRTVAIVMPHMFGRICRVEKIKEIAEEYGLYLIDDAAVAAGGKFNERYAGTLGDFGIITFNIGKNMNATGGGVLLTNSEEIYRKVNSLRLCLDEQTKKEMFAKLGYTLFYYRYQKLKKIMAFYFLGKYLRHNKDLGAASDIVNFYLDVDQIPREYQWRKNTPEKYREPERSGLYIKPKQMNILESTLAQIQLQKLEEINAKSIANANFLNEHFRDMIEITVPGGNSIYSYYQIILNKGDRYELLKFLARKGISAQWTFFPLHLQAKFNCFPSDNLNITNQLWKKVISLPIQPSLTTDDLYYIAKSIKKYYGK